MNVGIIAACLPTLKPLAANRFGIVSTLTSGERYSFRYSSRNISNARSWPPVSNGYLKQSEHSKTQSYPMREVRNDAAQSKTANSFEHRGFADGRVSYELGQRRGSSVAYSDEGILPQHKGIVRTTEVRVS